MQDEHHLALTDATWFERLSTVTLIVYRRIGCFPNWINETIQHSFGADYRRDSGVNDLIKCIE